MRAAGSPRRRIWWTVLVLASVVGLAAGLVSCSRRQIAAQPRQRVSGQTPAGATRRVSLHDGDARPIAKGRLGRPVVFGNKALGDTVGATHRFADACQAAALTAGALSGGCWALGLATMLVFAAGFAGGFLLWPAFLTTAVGRTSMGLTELAHFPVFPWLVPAGTGYVPGMRSVVAPAGRCRDGRLQFSDRAVRRSRCDEDLRFFYVYSRAGELLRRAAAALRRSLIHEGLFRWHPSPASS